MLMEVVAARRHCPVTLLVALLSPALSGAGGELTGGTERRLVRFAGASKRVRAVVKEAEEGPSVITEGSEGRLYF